MGALVLVQLVHFGPLSEKKGSEYNGVYVVDQLDQNKGGSQSIGTGSAI